MRISDWSSDVCSSDLRDIGHDHRSAFARQRLAIGAAQSGPAARHQRDLACYPAHNILSNRQGRPAVTPPVSKSVTSINAPASGRVQRGNRSEEHTSELQSLMRTSYAVFCLKKKKIT